MLMPNGAFSHSPGGGRLQGTVEGQAFKSKCCDSGLYIYMFNATGAGNLLSVRARNTQSGLIVWTYTHANLEGNVLASGLCMTEEGILIFAADGSHNLWLIDLEGELIRSGVNPSTFSFVGGFPAAEGNNGYIWGSNQNAGNGAVYLVKFNMTTFALIEEEETLIGFWQIGENRDRPMIVTDSTAGASWIFATNINQPARWDSADLSQTFNLDYYTPVPGIFPPALGQNGWWGFALNDAGAGAFYAQGFLDGVGGHWFQSLSFNNRLGGPSGPTGLRSPCWLSGGGTGVPNSIWIGGLNLERWSNPSTRIDAWAYTNIPGWNVATDQILGLNVDADKNMYFWWRVPSTQEDLVGATNLVRLNRDFETIDWIKSDADVRDAAKRIPYGRQILAVKGNGRSRPSEEAW